MYSGGSMNKADAWATLFIVLGIVAVAGFAILGGVKGCEACEETARRKLQQDAEMAKAGYVWRATPGTGEWVKGPE